MNDFFDSLKDIKKELQKEQNLRDEFLAYVKDADIKKC